MKEAHTCLARQTFKSKLATANMTKPPTRAILFAFVQQQSYTITAEQSELLYAF